MDTKKKLVDKIIQLQVDFFFRNSEMPNEVHLGGKFAELAKQIEEEETQHRMEENKKFFRRMLFGIFRMAVPYRMEMDFECSTVIEPDAESLITITHFKGSRTIAKESFSPQDFE